MQTLESLFSRSARMMKGSEIRELLKLTQRKEIISFAGGLPNPDAFPMDNIRKMMNHVMDRHAREALQYGTTEGHNKLRLALVHGMQQNYDVTTDVHNLAVTTGSQEALYLLSKVLLDPGDTVLTAAPTYIGATSTFLAQQANIDCIPLDDQGVRVDLLEDKLEWMARNKKLPKFLYLIPTFQNPSGVTIPRDRRREIYDLVCRYNLLLVEDDPYGLLRYDGDPVLPIKARDTEDRVVYLGTFSKILAPGFRIAWTCGPAELVNKMTLAKQAVDLCSNTFGQYIVYEAIHHNLLFPHISEIKRIYKEKRDAMLAAMTEHFPDVARWNTPDGGLFIWVRLPHSVNTRDMFPKAVAENVAYVVGQAFYPDGSGSNTMRLNFSHSSHDQIWEGIERLSNVIKEDLDKQLEPELIHVY